MKLPFRGGVLLLSRLLASWEIAELQKEPIFGLTWFRVYAKQQYVNVVFDRPTREEVLDEATKTITSTIPRIEVVKRITHEQYWDIFP